ncbi:F-box/kelch-repeat protein At3g23880-like [Rosa rugosa]|uniref:F-box/kelch-repeat protein At3g23880-like n=1 Tax=Rosa rugosa TaxID=74645 RepID=UPI002B41281B|nr:F-box/kelch-repeat protein At3g23880-like [Rosa rugosa]
MAELSKFAEEIIVEILSRLPPKSLMRFKCVRRSWSTLINNPNFAAKHLSSSKGTKLSSSSTTILLSRFLITDLNPVEMEMVLSLFNVRNDFDGCFLEDIHFPHSMGLECRGEFKATGFTFQMSCHCDGIICLADYGQKPTIVLCNPAIKEFKLLPESQLALSSPGFFPTAAVGFGCDLKSKNYKVVRLIHSGRDHNDQVNYNVIVIHPPKAEVYNLLTDSWKEIKSDGLVKENTIVLPYWNAQTNGIYFKGILYWCALEHEKVSKVAYAGGDEQNETELMNAHIISFDIGDETFHVTHIGSYDDCFLVGDVLGLWKESITLCVHSMTTLNIWVMDDFGSGKGSWTKYLAFEPVVKITSQLALFGKSDEQFALVACDFSVVILYDIFTNKFNYIPLNGALLHCTRAVEYVSSIVSVKEGNKLDMGASWAL